MSDIKFQVFIHWICEALSQICTLKNTLSFFCENKIHCETNPWWLNKKMHLLHRLHNRPFGATANFLRKNKNKVQTISDALCSLLNTSPLKPGNQRDIHGRIPVSPFVSCFTLLSPNRRDPIIFIQLIPQKKQAPIMSSSKPLKMPTLFIMQRCALTRVHLGRSWGPSSSLVTWLHDQLSPSLPLSPPLPPP